MLLRGRGYIPEVKRRNCVNGWTTALGT